jgi:5-oxopent-3-ene-1,2,5-tricarboxylate decarboxylase/2-hydroxyhepta-2,4-diene-1,7-dioate isomerase
MKIGKISIYPTKIICLGRNYLEHIKETDAPIPKEPVFFAKTINTLLTDNKPIIYPKILFENKEYNRVDHEVELAFILNRNCKNVSANQAYEYILGYTIFLDLTARNMQIKDRNQNLPWYRSKNFDLFGPIGPLIVPQKEIEDPHNLKIELKINGEIKQSSNTKFMIFKIPEILEYISRFTTLEKDDIIATGTPSGISPIKPGDIIEAFIENIGVIKHRVILEGNDK